MGYHFGDYRLQVVAGRRFVDDTIDVRLFEFNGIQLFVQTGVE
jgi:hypothetical protein